MATGVNQELFNGARRLIWTISGGLASTGGEGVAEALERLADQKLDHRQLSEPEPRRIPASRYFAECTAEIMTGEPCLAAALAAIEEHLQWRQSPAYSDAVLGKGFMDNYGWCQLIGPHGFFVG